MTFQQFLVKWTNPAGQRIDYDHVYAYQCVDLILQYIYECYGITGVRGNAIDYWNIPSANLMQKFRKTPGTDVAAGDIVVLNGLSGNPYGHIGIATGNQNATQLEIMEQNGGTGNGSGTGIDAIHTRWVYKNRMAGILRPAVAVTPPPTPMVSRDQLNQLFGDLLLRTPDQGAYDHYVGHFTYDFVANDIRNSAEFKIVHAPKPEPVPAPTVPAPPLPYTAAEKYALVATVMTFDTAVDAQQRINGKGTLSAGTYYVWAKENKAYSLTTDNTQNQNKWVNIIDNIIPKPVPVPVPVVAAPAPSPTIPTNDWQKTFQPFSHSIRYKALRDLFILDIAGIDKNGIRIQEGEEVPMQGTFVRSNMVYMLCRLQSDTKKERWYGVPTDDPTVGSPLMLSELYVDSKQSLMDNREYRRAQGRMTTEDKVYYANQLIARAVNSGVQFIDGIIPLKKLKAFLKGEDKK